MSSFQIIILIFALLLIYIYVKRKIAAKSIKQYNVSEVRERVRNSSRTILLDVRTNSERRSGHIKGSLHIPVNELGRRAEELNNYKDKEIIVYCRSGNRSLSAAALLGKKGFNAANLKGGFIHW